jgi:transcriptional regulator with PAS, ATPase and Fis domain
MLSHPTTLVGRSAIMRALDDEIALAARSDAKVLITGESGAGKEVAARLVHQRSQRSHAPFVAVNCAGIPESLLESELFGHVRGSFTGAHRDRAGLLEHAHRGTIFLDEIGEMPPRMQALLLRFLETGEVQRVGADGRLPRVDVRVISATHRNLLERISAGLFRDDLYYRLNVVHLHVPSLRARRDDIPALVECFLAQLADEHRLPAPTLGPDVVDALCAFDWPGNVRQLKNVLETVVARRGSQPVRLCHLPPELRGASRSASTPVGSPAVRLAEEVARDLLLRMTTRHESFWQVVYEPFMAHDLTREMVRRVVEFGLADVDGEARDLVRLFNLDETDRRRFFAFLRRYECLDPASGTPFAPAAASAGHPLVTTR